jgi:hypothetical protein
MSTGNLCTTTGCSNKKGKQDFCDECWKLIPPFYKREMGRLRRRKDSRAYLGHRANARLAVEDARKALAQKHRGEALAQLRQQRGRQW